MSTAPQGTEPGTISCPRCGAAVGPEQSWCLACGAGARTRLAPTPNWRVPVAARALLVALAGVALAVAFVRITGNRDTPSQTITTTAPAAAAPGAPTTAATAPASPTAAAPAVPGTPTTTAPGTTTAPPSAATAPPNVQTPTQTAPGG
ncbi:MAG: hypothetical protein ACXVFK_06910 [Solirubrobacteraceae bacterium]